MIIVLVDDDENNNNYLLLLFFDPGGLLNSQDWKNYATQYIKYKNQAGMNLFTSSLTKLSCGKMALYINKPKPRVAEITIINIIIIFWSLPAQSRRQEN